MARIDSNFSTRRLARSRHLLGAVCALSGLACATSYAYSPRSVPDVSLEPKASRIEFAGLLPGSRIFADGSNYDFAEETLEEIETSISDHLARAGLTDTPVATHRIRSRKDLDGVLLHAQGKDIGGLLFIRLSTSASQHTPLGVQAGDAVIDALLPFGGAGLLPPLIWYSVPNRIERAGASVEAFLMEPNSRLLLWRGHASAEHHGRATLWTHNARGEVAQQIGRAVQFLVEDLAESARQGFPQRADGAAAMICASEDCRVSR